MEFLPPEWHDQITSTNTVLLERLRLGQALPSGFVLAAREQTAGRGRQGRSWISRPGRDLTFSVLMRTAAGYPALLSLPMAAALGVAAALEEYGVHGRTKWPNDVQVSGRKICGILAEREGSGLVVGIGVNVNAEAADLARLDRPATSLRLETGREYPVESVLDRVLAHLAVWTEHWEEAGFAGLRQAWLARCVGLGEPVAVQVGAVLRRGILAGFGPDGELLLTTADGAVQPVWSGEVEAGGTSPAAPGA
jgi:BirA family biotin operon repressor/biotin-[acetyl-CoA-carboxylase] ligase